MSKLNILSISFTRLLLPFERYMKNELHKPFPKPYVRVRGKSRNGSDLDRGSLNGEQKDDDDISDEVSLRCLFCCWNITEYHIAGKPVYKMIIFI